MRDGGIIRVYSLQNLATPGFMPSEKLVYEDQFYFSKVTTGVTRRYAALGANRDYNAVIRCWNATIQDGVKYAVDENSVQYRIDVAEPVHNIDAVDLTLVRLEDYFDVADET